MGRKKHKNVLVDWHLKLTNNAKENEDEVSSLPLVTVASATLLLFSLGCTKVFFFFF